ncbi:hypothetical protein ACCS72_38800, partial [Rhizobium ruizarguesonis]
MVIDEKSAGEVAGGTDITRAPEKLSPDGPGTKVPPSADVWKAAGEALGNGLPGPVKADRHA